MPVKFNNQTALLKLLFFVIAILLFTNLICAQGIQRKEDSLVGQSPTLAAKRANGKVGIITTNCAENQILLQTWQDWFANPSKPAQCLNCEQVLNAMEHEVASLEQYAMTCATNTDCAVADNGVGTSFRGSCYAPVLASQKYRYETRAQYYNEYYPETNNVVQQFREQCGYAEPMCKKATSKCVNNRCILEFEQWAWEIQMGAVEVVDGKYAL